MIALLRELVTLAARAVARAIARLVAGKTDESVDVDLGELALIELPIPLTQSKRNATTVRPPKAGKLRKN